MSSRDCATQRGAARGATCLERRWHAHQMQALLLDALAEPLRPSFTTLHMPANLGHIRRRRAAPDPDHLPVLQAAISAARNIPWRGNHGDFH